MHSASKRKNRRVESGGGWRGGGERENQHGVAVSGVLEVSMKLELTSPAVMQFRNEAFSASENASLTRVCIVIFANLPSFNRNVISDGHAGGFVG